MRGTAVVKPIKTVAATLAVATSLATKATAFVVAPPTSSNSSAKRGTNKGQINRGVNTYDSYSNSSSTATLAVA